MSDVIAKINELQSNQQQQQSKQPSVEFNPDAASRTAAAAAATNDGLAEKYQQKLELVQSQLSDVTRQRLDYLEKLQQQHLEIQVPAF